MSTTAPARLSLSAPARITTSSAPVQRHHNEGHGRRLTAAFEAPADFPALAQSRDRLLRLTAAETVATGELVATVESDIALVIAVMRLANQPGRGRDRVESVVEAVEVLAPASLQALAGPIRTFDFFEPAPAWEGAPGRFRLHGVATQRAADRLAQEVGYEHRDRLKVSALLHDIGKLVLAHAYPSYPAGIHGDARTPEDRLHRERRELGVDHALVGGVLARRWGLPNSIASAIERHHSDDEPGEAAFVRLADMLANHAHDGRISPNVLLRAGRALGFGPAELRSVMYDLAYPTSERHLRRDPCPLSEREVEVLTRLAEGKVYKQIGTAMQLSTSTVRTHLHNIYGKLGAVDRAQAVLMATERGWLIAPAGEAPSRARTLVCSV